ncbi:MAG: MGMT family protein [Gammaproteobacteria bacterium]|nr:MGMT family protein [Gammaproteobacteria bacterium]
MSEFQSKFDKAIWRVVSRIKPGRVMSYGQVARAAGYPRHSRMVSSAMSRSDEPLPWYRVIRSDNTLAFDVGGEAYNKQRALLEKEGVRFIGKKVVPVESDDSADLDELLWGQ